MPFYLLIFILVFAPLAYGTTGPVALMIVQFTILSGLLWVAVAAARKQRKLYRPPGLLPLCLLGGLMLLQMVPLPPGLLEFVSPAAWQRYAQTVWLLQPDVWMPLSLNLQRTVSAFTFFATCFAFYLLAVQCLADSRRLKTTVRVVTVFAGLYALAAILESLVPNGRILWLLHPWPDYAGEPFGSYVNGNHFANLMGMLLPIGFILFLVEKPVVMYGSWREKLVEYYSDPRLGRHLLTGFAALLCAASIFVSLSRGGILSTLGAMLMLSLLLAWQRHHRRQALVLGGFIMVLFCFVGIFGWDGIFDTFARIRNQQGEIFDGRLFYWRDCLAFFKDFPLLGSGFGSFVDSYAGYQTIYQGVNIVDHAHNDYVELAVEGGAVGLLLAGWTAWSVVRCSWQAFGRRRKPFAILLFVGSLAGLTALLLHCIFEFNLHIGANGLYFAFLAALLVAAAHTSSQRGTGSELPLLPRRSAITLVPALVLVLLGSLLLHFGGLKAESALAMVSDADLKSLDEAEQAALIEATNKAIAWAPLDSGHRIFAAEILMSAGKTEDAWLAYGEALRRRPLSAYILQRAAKSAAAADRDELAGALFKAGVDYDRADLRRIKPYVKWLLLQQERDQAFREIRRGLELAPQMTRDFINLMLLNGVLIAPMAEALPEHAVAWQHYANFLVQIERVDAAERAYRQALQLMVKDDNPSAGVHWAYYKLLEKQRRFDDALAVILAGIELFPGHAGFHSSAGRLYERQQIDYRAREEYRMALLLNPKLDWVRKRLAKLESEPKL